MQLMGGWRVTVLTGVGCAAERRALARSPALAHDRFQPQARAPKAWGRVSDQFDLSRVDGRYAIQHGQEDGVLVPHQLGGSRDGKAKTIVLGVCRSTDEPLSANDRPVCRT